VNVVAVAVVFIGACTDDASPLRPVQMLWVNLIMDTLAALALATERPTDKLLERKPHGRYDPLITRKMWRFIIGSGVFQLAIILMLMYLPNIVPFVGLPQKSDWTDTDRAIHSTLIFNTFVFLQLINEFNARKLEDELNPFTGMSGSWIFLAVQAFSIAVQILLVEFGGQFTQTHGLSLGQWGVCLLLSLSMLPYGFLLRFLPVKNAPSTVTKPPLTPEEERTVRERPLVPVEEMPLLRRKSSDSLRARENWAKLRRKSSWIRRIRHERR
jgi:magnesium-transporting ATPase (P-type)